MMTQQNLPKIQQFCDMVVWWLGSRTSDWE